MLQKIKAFLYGSRWRADEHAWRVWQGLAPLVPANFVDLDSRQPLIGRVQRIYQQAHRGTKAVVHFGRVVGLTFFVGRLYGGGMLLPRQPILTR